MPFGVPRPDVAAQTSGADTKRHEHARRSGLYGLSAKKKLPSVQTKPTDVRVRKDLQVLHEVLDVSDAAAAEEELTKRKHQDHLGIRPPLDQLQPLYDLCTTVPKNINFVPNEQFAARPEWRVGYKNSADSHWSGGVSGMFEPSDSMREMMVRRQLPLTDKTTSTAYPVARTTPSKVEAMMQPDDWRGPASMLRTTNQEDPRDFANAWFPPAATHDSNASTATQPKKMPVNAVEQAIPVRKVTAKLKQKETTMDNRCVSRKIAELDKAAAAFEQRRQESDRNKQPHLRYSLPIENPTFTRAYRLGLEAMPSALEQVEEEEPESPATATPLTSDTARKKKKGGGAAANGGGMQFRPRSAACLVNQLRASKSTSALDPSVSVSRVAGAKRRPHSASLCYLSNSTLYCFDRLTTPAETEAAGVEHQADTAFRTLIDAERNKRKLNRDQCLTALAKKGAFAALPLPQVFARARREALNNLSRRLLHTKYERMTFDEFMESCGVTLQSSIETEPTVRDADGIETEEQEEESVIASLLSSVNESLLANMSNQAAAAQQVQQPTRDSVIMQRRVLVVSRQQLHVAMEPFSQAASDINMLFTALDLDVNDRVEVWEVVWAVDFVQKENVRLRRSRIKIKANPPPPDMEVLRNTVRSTSRRPSEFLFD